MKIHLDTDIGGDMDDRDKATARQPRCATALVDAVQMSGDMSHP